jgi:hypothetical protein
MTSASPCSSATPAFGAMARAVDVVRDGGGSRPSRAIAPRIPEGLETERSPHNNSLRDIIALTLCENPRGPVVRSRCSESVGEGSQHERHAEAVTAFLLPVTLT